MLTARVRCDESNAMTTNWWPISAPAYEPTMT
jgi:hypothetical protein